MRRRIPIAAHVLLALALLFSGAKETQAQDVAEAMNTFQDSYVEITWTTGESMHVFVQDVGENFLITRDAAGIVEAWTFDEIAHIESADPHAAESEDASVQDSMAPSSITHRSSHALQQALNGDLEWTIRRAGRGKLIAGSVLFTAGALVEALGIMSAIVGTRGLKKNHNEDWVSGMATLVAVRLVPAGAVLLGAGSALLVTGMAKRRRAVQRVHGTMDYGVAPALYRRGGGAEFRLQF